MGGSSGEKHVLVAVKSVTGEEWSEDKLLPGDIIDQLRASKNTTPISIGGKSALQRELRKIFQAGDLAVVRVKRGGVSLELRTCIIAEESIMRRKVYLLADHKHKGYIASLMDSTEEECLALQEQTRNVMEKRKIFRTSPMKDCLISYSWQAKMEQFLPSPNSAMVFSLILMPSDNGDLDNTTARAMAWLSASQASGVPINFVNIQSEALFLQSSSSRYFGAGTTEEPVDMVNSGVYTLHDLEGTEVNVTRAIRLWYSPPEGELAIILHPRKDEPRLGVNITCTEEGFCYVSSVDEGTAAERAGLIKIYGAACRARKLLVVSRVAGEKTTPWFVSSSGAIRCFNAISISEKISGHREIQQPIEFYFMVWNGATKTSKQQEDQETGNKEDNMQIVSMQKCTGFSESSDGSDKLFDSSGSSKSLQNVDHETERSSSNRSFSFHEDGVSFP